ncbi:putative acyl- dehydrogenase protein [Neofusicoccum parvum UCRNP2]|uniref:Putative acyl-dehydrogenase protein n=1 Tax=Botryosphaeria parva (strain UCR-NP2) TaxID=1287680 RepID=R1GC40_BOTPV|nr:putative acyl- dehydrogenase protein [Neofusicoccum parvum UCRNP2]
MTDAEPQAVQVDKTSDGITTITINRLHRRNAIDGPTAKKLTEAFLEFENDPTQKVCVFSGANGTFCAGFDLHEIAKFNPGDAAYDGPIVDANHRVDGRNIGPIGPSRMQIKKPVISAVSGYAVAGGLELSLLGDIRVAEEDAIFGVFCRRFGVPLIDGGTVRLQAIVGLGRALDMILTGRAVPAQEALQMGLANRVVPKGQALAEATGIARQLLTFPQACMNTDRTSCYYSAYNATSFEDALTHEFDHGIKFYDDAALTRALNLFLPKDVCDSIAPDLSTFGAKVLSPQVLNWVLDAERNLPYVKTFDSWGRRRDELITTEGWRKLQALGIAEGMAAIPYENLHGEFSRVHHFAKYALWCGSAAWVNCPTLMVDGVASLFRKHLSNPDLPEDQLVVLRSAYERLVSRDPDVAWTTGQWMTERSGGSDVSMTETVATYTPDRTRIVKAADGSELGPWVIDGFKWFSSATDANMMVMLAKTPKGISTFFAPMKRTLEQKDILGNDTELNGVHIQRLKSKLGTRALPTAELELKGVRAWLVGEEGRGTKEIATVLNVARIHNGVTAIGLWGRGLGVVRAFTKVRMVGRRPLWERTAFMRSLARMHVEYRVNVLFAFFVASLLGVTEQDQIALFTGRKHGSGGGLGKVPGVCDLAMAQNLLRLLTPALKGHCSKTSISGLQECMECLGGVGYLENDDMQFNIARL